MDMDKILDQLLMPPPTFGNGIESLRNGSTTSLDRSNNSSSTNSSNSSWFSDTSCGCHSPRSPISCSSSLIFHRKPILPPMVCSASRVEMQVYRTKSMEKERKRRQRCTNSLISKVEAILSSVETGSVSTSQESSPKIPLASSTLCPSDPTSLVEVNKIETSNSLQVQEHHQTSQDSDNQKTEQINEDSSSDEEESFHETAYRKSLQNLLHKSMTLDSSLQNSFVGGKSESKSINGTAPGSSTPTSSTGNTWAENTQATVVVVKNSKMSDGSDENLETPESRDSEDLMNSTASHFVDSVLEAVRSELGGFASMRSLPGQKDTYEPGILRSNPEKMDKTNTSSTSSPCKATDHINKALDILNTELACNKSGTTSISTSKDLTENSEIFTSSVFKDNDDFVSPSNCDVTMSTVTPETKEMIVSYKNAMESKEKSETEYTDNTTTDDTLEDKSYESTSKSQSTGKVSSNEGPDSQDVEVAHRVRSGSYSLDAPSPFLINSKDIHSIYSVEADDERGSETTESSIFCRDVKRRLEMPSDSEDSHTSVPSSCNKRTATKPKDGVKVNEYCQMLEEQHKNELMALQKQHELQLHMLQKELLKSKPHLTMSVEAITNMRLQDIEVCKKPALQNKNNMQEISEGLHKKFCKLSALIKGHLTRSLLRSRPVQVIMQTIRDTSRTILSVKCEELGNSTRSNESEEAVRQDETFLDRLFLQLQAAMYDLHDTFFATSMEERMEIISQSRIIDVKSKPCTIDLRKPPKLSAATIKSMQRKKQEKMETMKGKQPVKQVKSKISHIWKDGSGKLNKQKSPPGQLKKPSKKSQGTPCLRRNLSDALAPTVR